MSVKQAAKYLKCSDRTIRRKLKQGMFPNHVRQPLNNKIVIPLTDIDMYVSGQIVAKQDIPPLTEQTAVDTADVKVDMPMLDSDQVKEFIREEVKRAVQEEVSKTLIPVSAVDTVADKSLTRSERKLVTRSLRTLINVLDFLKDRLEELILRLERN